MDINRLHNEACKGDRRSVDELFDVLSSRYRMFARHKIWNQADAEEIVQEALMTIYAEYKTITFTTSFSAWACKVLDNRILAYIGKKKRESKRINQSFDQCPDLPKVSADPELKRKLLDCLQKICRRNMRYARILNLHYLGYKTGEICDSMDVKRETLYSALSKARAMLGNCLEKGDIEL